MIFRYLIILFLQIIGISFGQVENGQWKSLTSVLNNNDLVSLNNILYSATDGGLFVLENNEYKTFTTVNGLEGVNLTSLAIDLNSNLWIGGNAPNGFLQVYNPSLGQSVKIFDFGLTKILDIQIKNQFCWTLFKSGQDYGIMKFIYDDGWQYIDSYTNFPIGTGSLNCFLATDSTIYLGSDTGLLYSKILNNLKDPFSWSSVINSQNIQISSIREQSDKILFSSNSELYEINTFNEEITQINISFNLTSISNFFIIQDGLLVVDGDKIILRRLGNDNLLQIGLVVTSIFENENIIYAGTNHGFIIINDDTSFSSFIPNSPATNSFSSIELLDDGRLVCGSSKGLSIYSELGWRNILEITKPGSDHINDNYNFDLFIADTIPFDFGEYISDIEEGPDGLIYCAIRGSRVFQSNPPRSSGGIIIIDIDNPQNVTVIDTAFLSYYTNSGNSVPYQVVLDIEFDSDGNMWVANPYCTNGNKPIHVRSLNGEWNHFESTVNNIKISQSPISIDFDSWNRVWISSFQAEEANLGIYPNGGISLINYVGEPSSSDIFSYDIIKFDETVWSLAMGRNDRMYFLTPSGLDYYDLKEGSSPILRENPYSFYPNISFGSGSGIKIDEQGNVWIYSASQGIHVLSENTSYWPDINGIRNSNSSLLSDEIRDVDFDSMNNLVFIATSQGISVLRTPFGKEKLNYSKLKVFPSPFRIPFHSSLKVNGLPYNSSMSIMMLDGKTVRNIETQGFSADGDQLIWDGKDQSGELVSSGVYLIAIYGQSGSTHMEKITVIKN